MRVIAGEKGGRRLLAPAGRATRPTSDRVREAAFSILSSLDVLSGAQAWDLFAGSGALGIESLSRGAAHVTFVDSGRAALSATRSNLAQLGYGPDRADVVAADALTWVTGAGRSPRAARAGPGPSAPAGGTPGPGPGHPDLVFADPPYAWGHWPELLAALAPYRPLVLMETGSPVQLPPGWSVLKSKRYGGTVVTLASRLSGDDL